MAMSWARRSGIAAIGTLAVGAILTGRVVAQHPPYDPLVVAGRQTIATLDFTVTDTARHRDVPIREYREVTEGNQ